MTEPKESAGSERRGNERNFRRKLALGFGTALVVVFAGFLVSFLLIAREYQTKDHLLSRQLLRSSQTDYLRRLREETTSDLRAFLLTGEESFLDSRAKATGNFDELLAEFTDMTLSSELMGLAQRVRQASARVQPFADRVIQMKTAGAPERKVRQYFERDYMPAQRNLESALDTLDDASDRRLTELKQEAQENARNSMWKILALTLVAFSFSLLIAGNLIARMGRLFDQVRGSEAGLARAVQARDEMVAVVSHELKNPLTAIGTGIDLLLRTLPPEPGAEKAKASLLRMKPSLQRMNRLISDLLDITRIEARTLAIEPESRDVSALVDEAIETYAALAAEKSIKLSRNVPDGFPEIFCDRERIIQVLSNLLGNAIKFMEPGGAIVVTARLAESHAELSVTDTGPGIAEENLPKVFDRFWQAKELRFRGTGLGLSIAKGLVEAHGGTIWVRSRPGAGSTFGFALPLSGDVGQRGFLKRVSREEKPDSDREKMG